MLIYFIIIVLYFKTYKILLIKFKIQLTQYYSISFNRYTHLNLQLLSVSRLIRGGGILVQDSGNLGYFSKKPRFSIRYGFTHQAPQAKILKFYKGNFGNLCYSYWESWVFKLNQDSRPAKIPPRIISFSLKSCTFEGLCGVSTNIGISCSYLLSKFYFSDFYKVGRQNHSEDPGDYNNDSSTCQKSLEKK